MAPFLYLLKLYRLRLFLRFLRGNIPVHSQATFIFPPWHNYLTACSHSFTWIHVTSQLDVWLTLDWPMSFDHTGNNPSLQHTDRAGSDVGGTSAHVGLVKQNKKTKHHLLDDCKKHKMQICTKLYELTFNMSFY